MMAYGYPGLGGFHDTYTLCFYLWRTDIHRGLDSANPSHS